MKVIYPFFMVLQTLNDAKFPYTCTVFQSESRFSSVHYGLILFIRNEKNDIFCKIYIYFNKLDDEI